VGPSSGAQVLKIKTGPCKDSLAEQGRKAEIFSKQVLVAQIFVRKQIEVKYVLFMIY